MVVLVSLCQVSLLIFNDLVQLYLTVGQKASEIANFCRLYENWCLSGGKTRYLHGITLGGTG